jgi:preprotein translocase subunit SecE
MIKKIRQFLEEVRLELKKVSWPTFDELRGSTYVVLSLSIIVAVFLFIVDLILTRVLNIVL